MTEFKWDYEVKRNFLKFDKPLTQEMMDFLVSILEVEDKEELRSLFDKQGVDGEPFLSVFDSCDWCPSRDGSAYVIERTIGFGYIDWIDKLMTHYFGPKGYVLNGQIITQRKGNLNNKVFRYYEYMTVKNNKIFNIDLA